MSNRDVSLPGGLPVPSAVGPSSSSPAPARSPKAAGAGVKPFASVLAQAQEGRVRGEVKRKNSSESSSAAVNPHSRATRSAGRSREGGESAQVDRAKVPAKAGVRMGKESGEAGKRGSEEVGECGESRPSPSLPHLPAVSSAEEDLDGEGADLVEEVQSSAEDVAVLNVIPFPLLPVIVPFPTPPPLEEVGSGKGEKRGSEDVRRAKGEGRGAEDVAPLTSDLAPVDDDEAEGIDVVKLGLRPVRESSRPSNIEVVDFGGRSTAADAGGKIVSVDFRAAVARGAELDVMAKPVEPAESQLPGGTARGEDSARAAAVSPLPAKVVGSNPDGAKPAPGAGLPVVAARAGGPGAVPSQGAGTGAAKQENDMKSFSNTERLSGLSGGNPAGAAESDAASSDAAPGITPEVPGRGQTNDFTSRVHPATDWEMRQASRAASGSDQPVPVSAPTVDAAATVDRIASLVQREAALVRPHSSDSMAVVLRPDENTELFVHLTHRNGQVEATVRCERGDTAQLGALWSQLQETLSQQKVRLAPLQESPSNHSNFNQSTGSDLNGGGHGSQQRTPREEQFMDERPVPASSASASTPHVRGGGDSRHRRVTTSRPGWESWA